MKQSIQERIIYLINRFLQELMDYKFNERYGSKWYEEELLPFIKNYVQVKNKAEDRNYEKYNVFLNINSGNCQKNDIDVSFACTILLYENKYDFGLNKNIKDIINALRINRNNYSHATVLSEIEKISLNSKSIIDLQNGIGIIGKDVFTKDFISEVKLVKDSITNKSESNSADSGGSSLGKSVYEQEFDRAEDFFSNQNYKDAYEIHLELAMNGYIESIIRIGEYNQFGFGVEQNFENAINWYEKAEKAGYSNGKERIQKIEELNTTIEDAKNGNSLSQFKMGLAYEEGTDVIPNIETSLGWYEKSLLQGGILAKNRVIKLAAENHNAAIFALGNYYEINKDFEKSIEQYKIILLNDRKNEEVLKRIIKIANDNNPIAQFEMGKYYDEGTILNQDYIEAVKWYEKAAKNHHMMATSRLGLCYMKGKGVEKNYDEAVILFRKSLEKGCMIAQNSIGVCYSQGLGVEENHEEAIKWFRKAADQGYAMAQRNLGISYQLGQGVEKDDLAAIKFFRMAVDQGYAAAENSLGVAYESGKGVEKDLIEAVKWYKKAAEKGHAFSQFNLGECYRYGIGVEKDNIQSIRWYQKAADQGHVKSMKILGMD